MNDSIFIYGDKVRLIKSIDSSELFYGELDDLEIFKSGYGLVQKAHFSCNAREWSYLIKFVNLQVDNMHWFIESELKKHEEQIEQIASKQC